MDTMTLEQRITQLSKRGLKRFMRTIESDQNAKVQIDGRSLINFCSNNYLGLANDERLITAAKDCMDIQGFGSGASRLVCGNMTAHRQCEEAIAKFKGCEASLLFNTGYMANIGIISSLYNREDTIFSDKLNHASIVDGIQLSNATCRRYAHCDMNVLEEIIKSSESRGKKVIITDSVFSMDGDIAPLDRIVALAEKYHCQVMIDEAHALGVLGEHGKGAAEHFGCEDKIDIQMGTLSKAAGSFGAYCCGSKELIEFLKNKARSFIYTTGQPPSVAAASSQAIDIIKTEPYRRKRLWDNVRFMLSKINDMGFNTLKTETPIIPIIVGDAQIAVEFSERLLKQNILISAIRPPTVPEHTSRLRLTVMATHEQSDLEWTLDKIYQIGRSLGFVT